MIWIVLPHVSSSTALTTDPITGVGSTGRRTRAPFDAGILLRRSRSRRWSRECPAGTRSRPGYRSVRAAARGLSAGPERRPSAIGSPRRIIILLHRPGTPARSPRSGPWAGLSPTEPSAAVSWRRASGRSPIGPSGSRRPGRARSRT